MSETSAATRTGANAVFFETRLAARVAALDADADPPRAVKLVGAVSLVAWLAVLYCGRMLPFLGDAY